MNRSKYAFEEIHKTEAIQFKGLDENKFDVVEFFKDLGQFKIEFVNFSNSLKIHKLGDFSYIAVEGDYIVMQNGKVRILEKEYFESTYKKVL